MFSISAEYAIKIMIYLSLEKEASRNVGLKEITESINSPEAFTAKILQQLVKNDLLYSQKGRHGGFRMKSRKTTTIGDVVAALDGEVLMNRCVLGLEECSEERPCPVHQKFLAVKAQLKSELLSIKIDDLQGEIKSEGLRLK